MSGLGVKAMVGPVQVVIAELWKLRECGELMKSYETRRMSECVSRAVVAELDGHERDGLRYEPLLDRRVEWAREVLLAAMVGDAGGKPRACAELEAFAQYHLRVGDFDEEGGADE